MGRVKNIGITYIRKAVHSRGDAFELAYIKQLEPADYGLYLSAQPRTWRPLEEEAPKCYTVAAQMFFPDHADAMSKLGHYIGRQSVTGMIKLFLRLSPTKLMFMQAIAATWRYMHDTGKAFIEEKHDTGATIALVDYPNLPKWYIQYLRGYITAYLELSGCKDITLTYVQKDTSNHQWICSWSEKVSSQKDKHDSLQAQR